jgi:hypothetical protein
MLMAMPTELLDGLLDGLDAQSEMTELLEELYYDGLSSKSSSASNGARGLLHDYRRRAPALRDIVK